MVLDLQYGRRIYDWVGGHPGIYRFARRTVCLGREGFFERRVVELVGLKRGDRVLDLACGNGVNFKLLGEKVGGEGRIVALDYSVGMLGCARRQAEKLELRNVEFVQADAARVEFEENSLDGAICTFGLSAVPDDKAAVQNVHRALKPGGRFVVFDGRPFKGVWRFFNPVVGPFFKYTQNWDGRKDLLGGLREVFGEVEAEEYNGGSGLIAVAIKG